VDITETMPLRCCNSSGFGPDGRLIMETKGASSVHSVQALQTFRITWATKNALTFGPEHVVIVSI